MNRYNIFSQVHKGLKALLYETALCLQQTDFTNSDEADSVLEKVENVIMLFDKHAHTEDTIVFAAIQQDTTGVVHAFEQEHEQDQILGMHLHSIVSNLRKATNPNDKVIGGSQLNQSFVDFMIFNLTHMAKEEDIINKSLWKHYSDAELVGLTQKIIESIPTPILEQYNKWMMRGMSNNEITIWLKEVKNSAPDFIFQSLMKTAETELNKFRLQTVQETITDGAMLA